MVKPQIKKEKRKHKKVVTLRQYTFFKVKTSHTYSLPSLSFLVFTTKNTKRVEFSNISNLLHYHTTTTFPWLPKPISTLHQSTQKAASATKPKHTKASAQKSHFRRRLSRSPSQTSLSLSSSSPPHQFPTKQFSSKQPPAAACPTASSSPKSIPSLPLSKLASLLSPKATWHSSSPRLPYTSLYSIFPSWPWV